MDAGSRVVGVCVRFVALQESVPQPVQVALCLGSALEGGAGLRRAAGAAGEGLSEGPWAGLVSAWVTGALPHLTRAHGVQMYGRLRYACGTLALRLRHTCGTLAAHLRHACGHGTPMPAVQEKPQCTGCADVSPVRWAATRLRWWRWLSTWTRSR